MFPFLFRLTPSLQSRLADGRSISQRRYVQGMYLFDADQSDSRDPAGKKRRDGVEALAPPTKLLGEPPAPRTVC